MMMLMMLLIMLLSPSHGFLQHISPISNDHALIRRRGHIKLAATASGSGKIVTMQDIEVSYLNLVVR